MREISRRDLLRVVVGVDPAVTSGEDSDMTGVVVAGKGADGCAYVLADLTCKLSPEQWGRRVIKAYKDYAADRVVCEVNQGGDLLERMMRAIDPHVSYRGVHARKGKYTRAEPVAALYEQGKVFHAGRFPELEDQLCSYTPEHEFAKSPDRADALVWALTDLMLGEGMASLPDDIGPPASRRW